MAAASWLAWCVLVLLCNVGLGWYVVCLVGGWFVFCIACCVCGWVGCVIIPFYVLYLPCGVLTSVTVQSVIAE